MVSTRTSGLALLLLMVALLSVALGISHLGHGVAGLHFLAASALFAASAIATRRNR